MLISEQIARLIEEMIEEGSGCADIKRNDLAQSLGCVTSQVSYVISSRFNRDRGYVTESRRGGGGYIRIVRVVEDKDTYLERLYNSIGQSITAKDAQIITDSLLKSGIITEREAGIMMAPLTNAALFSVKPPEYRDRVRANILRHIIWVLML